MLSQNSGADFAWRDVRLLSRRFGGAEIDQHRREADQRQDHGDKTEVMRAEQARQHDRRRQLDEDVQRRAR